MGSNFFLNLFSGILKTSTVCFLRRSKSQQEHRDSPAIIGSDTPVNPEDLMFADLRSGTVGDETWNNPSAQEVQKLGGKQHEVKEIEIIRNR